MTEVKKKYEITEFKKRGKLILADELLTQIFYLHSRVGKTEWSGVLLYDVVSGSPADPDNFVLKAKNVFLMNIGTSGYTAYDFDSDIVDMYDNVPNSLEMKIGQIHTHHTMETFFSTVDMDELNDNVAKHNYYLSLIVNMEGKYSAKVAFVMKRKTVSEIEYKDDSGQSVKFDSTEEDEGMGIINMSIVLEYKNDFFYERLNDIQEAKVKKEKEKATSVTTYYHSNQDKTYEKKNTIKKYAFPYPKALTDKELLSLISNVIGVNVDITEKRSPYDIILSIVKDETKGAYDEKMYGQFLEENIEAIMTSFFGRPILGSEKKYLANEIIPYVKKFVGIKKFKPYVNEVCLVVNKYANGNDFRQDSQTAESLDEEMANLM